MQYALFGGMMPCFQLTCFSSVVEQNRRPPQLACYCVMCFVNKITALALFLFRNTILPRCSSRAERFAQLWTVVMIACGIGIFRIVRHFLIAPVTTSNTFCVPWIFPVGPNKIPGKVRPRFVFVMTASSFASTYAPNRPRA